MLAPAKGERAMISEECQQPKEHTTQLTSPFTFHADRSEEHTSELQSQSNLVCRLLLEKKNRRPPCSRSYASTEGGTPNSRFLVAPRSTSLLPRVCTPSTSSRLLATRSRTNSDIPPPL